MNIPASFLAMTVATLLSACSKEPLSTTPSSTSGSFKDTETRALPVGSFSSGSGGYAGDVYVEGFAETVTVQEPFCNQDCETFAYVRFTVTDHSTPQLADFLSVNAGNAYAGPGWIGLGCTEDGILTHLNQSIEYGMKEFTLPKATATAILHSTERDPVILHLTKLTLGGGTEAPACYSHFTTIELVEN